MCALPNRSIVDADLVATARISFRGQFRGDGFDARRMSVGSQTAP